MEEVVARILQLFLAMTGAWAIALWFAMAVWTYRDITARTTNPITHIFSTLMVVLFWVPGAIIYLVLRPRETLDEAFQRAMEEEYLLQDLDDFPVCPSCRRSIHDDFLFCPHCATELRRPCASCERPFDLRWEVCAYCGSRERRLEGPVAVPAKQPGRGRQPSRKQTGSSRLQAIDGGKAQRHDEAQDSAGKRRPRDVDGEQPPAADAAAATATIPIAPSAADGAAPPTNGRAVRGRGARDRGSESRPVESGS